LFGGSLPARAGADHPSLPTLYTNQQLIEDVTRRSSLDVDNIKSVLDYVLSQLPERVRVLPTENYFYFYFYHNGIRYAGNLRFDVGERDKGFVEFIYFKDSTDWMEDERDHHATLGPSDGVRVEKVDDLVYRVSFAGKSVTFELNDLSDVRPPANVLGKDETFLGPVADESGIRLLLVFDEALKLFHYVLDETAPVGDELVNVEELKHILIGRRTGFAFLKDPALDRKLLVGVYLPNIAVNNYLDGPFDQLPDNFLKGDELRRAILLARPDLDTPIDRLGIAPGGETRESIAPYLEYELMEDLAPAEQCTAKAAGAAVYQCLDALVAE
jgi:hypothetical protein